MEAVRVAPRCAALSYGSWPSPIGAVQVARAGVRLSEPAWGEDGAAWWLERRPQNEGRTTLVREGEDVTPPSIDVRTKVHEYGGGAWLLDGQTAYFSNFADQRLYRLDPGGEPVPLTPEGPFRYADGRVTPGGDIVCVRETHAGRSEAVNELVRVPAAGGEPYVLAAGSDFYAFPRVRPDGGALAWLCWDHPNMPWDGCELQVDGRRVAGGPDESLWQPEWSPDGRLHWVSDRDGWWNLYREGEQLTRERAELGYPQWMFAGSTYAFLAGGAVACIVIERAVERLCLLRGGRLLDLELPYTTFGFPFLRSRGDRLLFIAGAPDRGLELVSWSEAEGGRVLRRAADEPLDRGFVSIPEAMEFESAGDRTAHAFYYPPAHPDRQGPPDERPPLLVQIHGGPTGHAPMGLDEEILYWTSRGLGVVDVNYGGSTGFGRDYRNLLRRAWGIVDVDDCVAAALSLAGEGRVDRRRLAIHGGSAGGYTTLAALVFRPEVFAAGASYYGVADAETLARDTHKFESRYLDGLIAPYPDEVQVWRERSPIHFADRIRVPVLLLQGLEDAVVPPSQAEQTVEALKRSGVPHAYLAFAGEQHGFRRSETIIRALEAELSFYAQVLSFEPAGTIQEVTLWTR